MNAEEVSADQVGDASLVVQPTLPVWDLSTGPDWGWLEHEPCRYCYRPGGVYFLIDDSPFGKNARQVVKCLHCRNTWEA